LVFPAFFFASGRNRTTLSGYLNSPLYFPRPQADSQNRRLNRSPLSTGTVVFPSIYIVGLIIATAKRAVGLYWTPTAVMVKLQSSLMNFFMVVIPLIQFFVCASNSL
jgi:hypothetical protein